MRIGLGLDIGATPRRALSPVIRPEAHAVLARMTTPPSPERRELINGTIEALISGGVWSKLDALYFFAAHTAQASLLNWRQNQFNITLNSAPAFVIDEGYTGDGVDDSLGTGFQPGNVVGANYLRDNASLGCYEVTNVQAEDYSMGPTGGSHGAFIQSRVNSGDFAGAVNDGTSTGLRTVAVGTSVGLSAANRSGASDRQLYKNGVQVDTDTTASTGISTVQFHFLRAFSTYSTRTVSGGFIGGSLTAAEHETLYEAMHDYMVAVGADT
jgi:hypothetical protein